MKKQIKASSIVLGLAAIGVLGFGGHYIIKNMRNRDKKANVKESETYLTKVMREYYPELVVGVEYMETNRERPVLQSGESRHTYWNGLTWFYTRDMKGNLKQHECNGIWKDKAAKLNAEQRYEQFRMHLEFETFARLKNVTSGKKLNHNEVVALCLAGYQLPAKMAVIAEKLDQAKNNQEIIDAFKYGPAPLSWREGSFKRRWWCGAYALGLVTYNDFLDLKKDAFSEISLSKVATGVKKDTEGHVLSIEHFKYDRATVEYALNVARNSKKKDVVRDVLDKTESGRAAVESLLMGKAISFSEGLAQSKYDSACAAFNAGNYKDAQIQFEKLLAEYPDDAGLWNDLAATYNALGKYEQAIECTRQILNKIKDSSQYAAAYYNAGVARENMGNYESALANYQAAIKHGNKSKAAADGVARMDKAVKAKNKPQAYIKGAKELNVRAYNRAVMQKTNMCKPRTYNA